MSDGTVAEVLAAMADPTRRALLDSLAAGGEASATALSTGLPVTRQAVVKHLAVLERAGLVTPRREGREVRYALRPAPLADAASWLGGLAAEWDARTRDGDGVGSAGR
ncbi:transcriptional regulator [Actinorhabdospora filicis]|uniref:Transcriptional regulator n=1 Tax=Actinorhabdospora filicis TaxID=1785913 RepID=A0A9W6SRW5_9ACTN|nr:metalloregulator ArsR/SmtB family transcription factor [Actinorhabdospora filicis]GLZ80835.1 transcriptional regulator [Actinorhabdospora filicis]